MAWIGCALTLAAAQTNVADWTFNRPGDLQGWRPNGDLAAVVVSNGVVSCRARGPDPIFEFGPSLTLSASPRQFVEIRLKADRDGTAELFWSNTDQGRYGGFSQEKTTRFSVRGDNAWRTYRLLPMWQREGKIVRLRFDLYDAARFEWAWLRVIGLDPGAKTADKDSDKVDYPIDDKDWQWVVPVENGTGSGKWAGGPVSHCGEGFLFGPLIRVNTSNSTFVSVEMRVDRGRHGTVYYGTDASYGLHSCTFPLQADGRDHIYNIDLLKSTEWRGNVVALGLQPSNDTNATAAVRSIKVTSVPSGPAQLRVDSFAVEQALPRVGIPASITAIVANTGGATATNVRVKLVLPAGVQLLSNSPPEQVLAALGFDEEQNVSWNLTASQPAETPVHLEVSSPGAAPVTATAVVRCTLKLQIPSSGYVPEPKPVRGQYEVGTYYFPGWKTASQWQPLQRFPERKPVLGCYREGDPEVADWHIKWAVEHGITFFAYDWYWSTGARQLEHALHDGYFKARYRHLLKFCLLWANHNPPGTSSLEDCVAVTRFWIENYFRRAEYLQFDGKPVMLIFSPDRLTEDLGVDGTKRALEAMRAESRKAGLKGLYFVACVGEAGGARKAAAEGYDSISAYNWPGLGMSGEGKSAPFEPLVEGYRRQWEQLASEIRLPLTPVPVCGGWDSRPWHGENNLVRYGRTPALFKRHLQDAKQFLDRQASAVGHPKAILVEAWNEWGEGSYIEPHAEFGFGYLDAMRDVFTGAPAAHEDVTPADVGLGPYDVPAAEATRTSWEFPRDGEVWKNTMQMADLSVSGGVISARTAGNDPAFFGPAMQAKASDFGSVLVRMRLSSGSSAAANDTGQLFWRTARQAEDESSSVRFPVTIDRQWHDYVVAVAGNPRWRGTITRVRLDPCNQAGIKVDIERIELRGRDRNP